MAYEKEIRELAAQLFLRKNLDSEQAFVMAESFFARQMMRDQQPAAPGEASAGGWQKVKSEQAFVMAESFFARQMMRDQQPAAPGEASAGGWQKVKKGRGEKPDYSLELWNDGPEITIEYDEHVGDGIWRWIFYNERGDQVLEGEGEIAELVECQEEAVKKVREFLQKCLRALG